VAGAPERSALLGAARKGPADASAADRPGRASHAGPASSPPGVRGCVRQAPTPEPRARAITLPRPGSYAIGFGIPTGLMGLAILVLVLGAAARLYVYAPPEGSPLLRIWRVLAGAVRNRNRPAPVDASELFGARPPLYSRRSHDLERSFAPDRRRVCAGSFLWCCERANAPWSMPANAPPPAARPRGRAGSRRAPPHLHDGPHRPHALAGPRRAARDAARRLPGAATRPRKAGARVGVAGHLAFGAGAIGARPSTPPSRILTCSRAGTCSLASPVGRCRGQRLRKPRRF
jgi:hypothetical protein